MKTLAFFCYMFMLILGLAPIQVYSQNKKSYCDLVFQTNIIRARKIKRYLKNYGKEVIDSRGLRLIVRDVKKDAPTSKVLGLFTEQTKSELTARWYQSPIDKTFQLIPRKVSKMITGKPFNLQPFGVVHYLVNKPVKWHSKDKKELTNWFVVPLDLALSVGIYLEIDEKYSEKLAEKEEEQFIKFGPEYDHLIESDYRFAEIKKRMNEESIPTESARSMAYRLLMVYNNYYDYMGEKFQTDTPQDSFEKLIHHPLFVDINHFLEKGKDVTKFSGFKIVDEEIKARTQEQKNELLQVKHLLLQKYQLIPEMVKDLEKTKSIISNQELIKNILSDPFTEALFELYKRKDITQDELIYRLQEDAHWQSKFQLWQVGGLIRFKKIDGVFSDTPLTIDDIRYETLQEIVDQVTVKKSK